MRFRALLLTVGAVCVAFAAQTALAADTRPVWEVGGELDDVAPVAATEGMYSAVRITAQRAFHLNLRNASGTEIGTAAAPIRNDPTGTTNQPVTQATSPWVTSRNWTLSSGTDSIAAVESGTWVMRLQDGSGNAITSQVSGAQRALDVGINVAGVQVDPRTRTWNLSSSDVPLVSQGTAAAAAGGWPVKLTDGTNTTAVKAASTAPLATDPAAVVVQSPNGNHATAANQATEITALQLIDNPVGSVAAGTAGTSSYLGGGVYNTALPSLTNGQQAAMQLDASGRHIVSDAANGSVTGGTAGAKSELIGGQYNTTLPVLTNGQQAAIQVDNNGRIITSAITGFGADFVFGDITLSAIALATVRRTTYTEPAAAAAFSVKSASAADAAAGTGARTVRVHWADASVTALNTEVITLNGTTCVNSVATTAKFFEDFDVTTAGSGGTNAGILTLYTGTGCVTAVGTVNAGDEQTFWAHHYVPTGKTCNITGLSVSHNGTTVGSGGVFAIKALDLSLANANELQVGDFHRLYGQSSTAARQYLSPIKVVGPARILVYVTPETSTSTVYRASLDFFEP